MLQALQELKNQKTNRHLMNLSTISYEVSVIFFWISWIFYSQFNILADHNIPREDAISEPDKRKYSTLHAGSEKVQRDQVGSAVDDQW